VQQIIANDAELEAEKVNLENMQGNERGSRQKDKLTVFITGATNLPAESYAQVNIYQGNKMAQTNPQRGTSPQWNQTLLFEVDDFRSALIIVLLD
jgi:hypothetical protein